MLANQALKVPMVQQLLLGYNLLALVSIALFAKGKWKQIKV